jgi:peptidoglycan-associated lipoprotein
MRNLAILLYVLILVSYTSPVAAQRKDRTIKARETFAAGEYTIAIDLFKDAYNKISDKEVKKEIIFLIAECYRMINAPDKAELRYKQAISKEYPNPVVYLHYGDALRMNEEFDEAEEQYRTYQELVPDDPRGQFGLESCQKTREWLDNPTAYMVENMKFFNSRQSDYSPFFASEDYQTVYFTSSREASSGNELHGATGEDFTDIFQSRMDRKGKWSVPVPLDENINTEFEDGTPVLNSDYSVMYFTRCKVNKNTNYGCQIYTANRGGDTWSKADALVLADDSVVIAHPAISSDELTLYFVSDMAGGSGGKDIWKVTRSNEGDEWSEPENLGEEINTVDDEVFPYIHADGTLYFSSNGRVGMGGLDIFKAVQDEEDKWQVENMKSPINSTADDFGIVFEQDMERGFFSSTRKSRDNDEIYSFVLPPLKFNVSGLVKDSKTDELLAGSVVKSIGSDGITIESTTGGDGSFKFMLKANTDYVFVASRTGYLNGKERETTKGLEVSTDFKTTIYLASIAKPIELSNSNVFYDFAKWDLRPEAMVSLDKLIETLLDNPNITIELMSHTDARASDEFNMELSQKRAQSVVDYLIERGIASGRLQAKGYGESMPKIADAKIAEQYPFLKNGTELTEAFINSLTSLEQQEIAHQFNRRTEFRVLSTDYQGQ